MRKLILNFIVIVFVMNLFVACKKEYPAYGTLPETNGLVSATVNGQLWSTAFNTARYSLDDDRKFGFGGNIYVNGFATQSFGLTDISLDKPMQKVYSVNIAQDADLPWGSFDNREDDASLNGYSVVDSAENNFVSVDSYDPATRKVKGRFNLTMYRYYNTISTPGFDDTIIIKDGTYELTLTYRPAN